MRIIERLESNPRKALVQCPSCLETKEMDYYKQRDRTSEDCLCHKCTLTSKEHNENRQQKAFKRIDQYVEDHNSLDNGIYLLKFTKDRSECLVQCNKCSDEYVVKYTRQLFNNKNGCRVCVNKLGKVPKKERSVYYTKQLANIYNNMVQRTTNPKSEAAIRAYKGIFICKEWVEDRELFYKWSHENGYVEGTKLSIDRIENNKGYSPDNCRWATKTVQARNTKVLGVNNTSGYKGVSKTQDKKKYRARITVDSKERHLGSFDTALEAALAYDNYILTHGLEHTLNFGSPESGN